MESHLPQAHPCFRLEIRFPLSLPARLDPFDVWHGLSYRIIREPGDLLAHTRRVLLCRHPQLRTHLAGALHDLFQATDGAGNALKQRLLDACRKQLSTAEANRFQARIDSPGSPITGETPDGSVLPTMTQLLQRGHRATGEEPAAADSGPASMPTRTPHRTP